MTPAEERLSTEDTHRLFVPPVPEAGGSWRECVWCAGYYLPDPAVDPAFRLCPDCTADREGYRTEWVPPCLPAVEAGVDKALRRTALALSVFVLSVLSIMAVLLAVQAVRDGSLWTVV